MNQDKTKQNYEEYHYTKKEVAKYLFSEYSFVRGSGLSVLSELVVHDRGCAGSSAVFKMEKKTAHQGEEEDFELSVKDALNSLSVAVQAGYSVENAVTACMKDMERLYPPEADIVREFHYIESRKKVSVPVEELFLGLGERSGIEDIENFAAVFSTAKRSGGDMDKIIQTSARMIGDKIDVRKEIETTLSAKKAEQMIMSLMPAGIILYLQLTSPGFLEVLYGNPFGVCAMTVCLGIYGLSYWLGKRIVDIEV